MRITNKMHRGLGIAAGVIMLLLMVSSSITSVVNLFIGNVGYLPTEYIVTTIVTLVLNDIVLTLMAIMLLRGKKDVLAGVIFIIAAVYMLISCFRGVIVSFSSGYVPDYIVTSMIIASVADLIGVAFRILIAVECFKAGSVSGSGAKVLMILLPILIAVVAAISTIVNTLGLGYTDTALIVTNIIVAVVASITSLIPQLLMALAVSVPVKEPIAAPTPVWQQPYPTMQ